MLLFSSLFIDFINEAICSVVIEFIKKQVLWKVTHFMESHSFYKQKQILSECIFSEPLIPPKYLHGMKFVEANLLVAVAHQ